MSIKLRFKYQFQNFFIYLRSVRLPEWVFGGYVRLVIAGLVVAAGAGYLSQVSHLSTSGYVIHDLENKVSQIESETQKIKNEIAVNQSISNIQKRLPEANLIAVTQIKYISANTDLAVANR